MQDTFELFARDVLSYLGYRIIEDPDRGADGKRDLIVEELLQGIHSEYSIRWLVSCKHFAHSGRSVSESDEPSIRDRLEYHGCQGFMGFYSTLQSSGLSTNLNALQWHCVFDRMKIEGVLVRDLEGQRIAARYFPESFKRYLIDHPSPSNVFPVLQPIECEICHKNLLTDTEHGNYVMLQKALPSDADGFPKYDSKYSKIVFVCKDHDAELMKQYHVQDYRDSWDDIDDICNPYIWIAKLMAFINGVQKEHCFTEEAFEKMKVLFVRTYPYVCRHMTTKEEERVQSLQMFGLL